MSLLSADELQDDISIFEQSSPESLRARATASARAPALAPHAHEQYSSTSDGRTLNGDTDDDYFSQYKPIKQCTSSRSSISSFPASVVHHTPFTDNEDTGFRNPSRTQSYDRTSKTPSHGYLSAFRNPSSVRALQLESEFADSDTLSIRNLSRPRQSPRVSHLSPRSPGSVRSSPTKRSSRSGTPLQQRQSSSKLKKEFPLVLLHCTLLPPAVAVRGPQVSDDILEAVLPEEYRKRWRTLQDKVTRNTEVKQRGVLIPHPREDYEVLEERLLETLELERPRVRRGHYLGSKGSSDSGFESSSQNGTDEASDADETKEGESGERCADCGKAVSCKIEQERRWEVKVFAANGLMRSGAWAAAWEEMEKVDVEMGVWMPEDVRGEVEERLKALQAKEEAEKPVDEPAESKKKGRRTRTNTARLRHDERMKEIYGHVDKPKTQAEIDGLVDEKQEPDPSPLSSTNTFDPPTSASNGPTVDAAPLQEHSPPTARPTQENFLSFMRRHSLLIWNDQKNLAIVLLSIMVLLFSVQNANISSSAPPVAPQITEPTLSSPVTSAISAPASDTVPVSYVTTTVFATPTTALSSSIELETKMPVPAKFAQDFESDVDIAAFPVPAKESDKDPQPTDFPPAPGVHKDVEVPSTASEPVSHANGSDVTNEVDCPESTSMVIEESDDDHADALVPGDLQRDLTVDFESAQRTADAFESDPQPEHDEHTRESTAVIDLNNALQENKLVSPNIEIEELNSTLGDPDFEAGTEDDRMLKVPDRHLDEPENVIESVEQTYLDVENEDGNNA